MTTRRRSRKSFRGSGRRPEWDSVLIADTTSNAQTQQVTDLTNGFHTDERKGLTVVRLIGNLAVSNGTNNTASFAAGIAMISDEAFSASVPDPAEDAQVPWLWWHRSMPASDRTHDYVIDSRAKRKFLDAAARLVFVFQNDDTATNLQFTFGVRVLYLLP